MFNVRSAGPSFGSQTAFSVLAGTSAGINADGGRESGRVDSIHATVPPSAAPTTTTRTPASFPFIISTTPLLNPDRRPGIPEPLTRQRGDERHQQIRPVCDQSINAPFDQPPGIVFPID